MKTVYQVVLIATKVMNTLLPLQHRAFNLLQFTFAYTFSVMFSFGAAIGKSF